jgi:hypothetical protein
MMLKVITEFTLFLLTLIAGNICWQLQRGRPSSRNLLRTSLYYADSSKRKL